MLSPRLQLRVAQKQILTPGLVQMVTVLQLNRLELKDMIVSEIAQNPVLEEAADGGEEITPEEVQAILEAERVSEPADQSFREAMDGPDVVMSVADSEPEMASAPAATSTVGLAEGEPEEAPAPEVKTESDPFDEIDLGSYFAAHLEPGYTDPASENVETP